jgi:putative ABC transport system substrate-binding protein
VKPFKGVETALVRYLTEAECVRLVNALGGAAAMWPLAARAQQPRKLSTIGFVGPSTAAVDSPLVGPFVQQLGELGWVEGRNIVIDYRPSEGLVERASEIAAEFVRLKVDVIVTGGDAQALVAKRATAEIPIVFGAQAIRSVTDWWRAWRGPAAMSPVRQCS